MIMLTCMKNGNNQNKRADKLLPVVAVGDGPLTRADVDAWDPSFIPKLKRNSNSVVRIYFTWENYINK